MLSFIIEWLFDVSQSDLRTAVDFIPEVHAYLTFVHTIYFFGEKYPQIHSIIIESNPFSWNSGINFTCLLEFHSLRSWNSAQTAWNLFPNSTLKDLIRRNNSVIDLECLHHDGVHLNRDVTKVLANNYLECWDSLWLVDYHPEPGRWVKI